MSDGAGFAQQKNKTMKKALKIVLLSVLVLVIVAGVCAYVMFHKQYAAAQSVEKVDDKMYTMTYRGDYGLDDFLEQGGASSSHEIAEFVCSHFFYGLVSADVKPADFGCSFISVKDKDGNMLTGRNFDWPDCKSPIAIIHTRPEKDYASVSTACISFLGFGDDWSPKGLPEKMALLAAIYAPLDGMNEKGLVVADLVAGDHTKTNQNTGRVNLTTTSSIRVLLDKAANVEEALQLLESCDMHSDIDFSHHLAISDAKGRSVVVEWVDNKMLVVETPLCTNHYLAESRLKDHSLYTEDSHRRLDIMQQMRDSLTTMKHDDVVESISRVASEEMTRWSVVFDSKALTATYYQYGNFGKPYSTAIIK